MTKEPAKRIGRPPLLAEQRKSRNLTFRTRNGMRERLEAAAHKAGRSISEEIESRLEMSFEPRRWGGEAMKRWARVNQNGDVIAISPFDGGGLPYGCRTLELHGEVPEHDSNTELLSAPKYNVRANCVERTYSVEEKPALTSHCPKCGARCTAIQCARCGRMPYAPPLKGKPAGAR